MPAFPRAQSASFISALNSFLEKEIAIHSSILVWETPWREEPGGLQSMGSQRVGHNLATEQQQQEDINQQSTKGEIKVARRCF